MSIIKSKPASSAVAAPAPKPLVSFDVVILDFKNSATNVPVLERQSNFDQCLKFATELFCISSSPIEIWRRIEYPTLVGADKIAKESYRKVVVLKRIIADPVGDISNKDLDSNLPFNV